MKKRYIKKERNELAVIDFQNQRRICRMIGCWEEECIPFINLNGEVTWYCDQHIPTCNGEKQ